MSNLDFYWKASQVWVFHIWKLYSLLYSKFLRSLFLSLPTLSILSPSLVCLHIQTITQTSLSACKHHNLSHIQNTTSSPHYQFYRQTRFVSTWSSCLGMGKQALVINISFLMCVPYESRECLSQEKYIRYIISKRHCLII